jgi:hypothetical protein
MTPEDTSGQAHVRAMQLPSFRRCLRHSAMSEEGFVGALLQTSLSRLEAWTLPDLERLLAASLRYNLDPTGREIFLVPDHAGGAPILVVGVDGWSRILNESKQFAGLRFRESLELEGGIPAWIECSIFRWDRRVATTVREYLCEVRGASSAWITHPRRMLRHKAMVQCARVAFGMSDIVDPDEAARICEKLERPSPPIHRASKREAPKASRRPTSVSDMRNSLKL